MRKEVDSEQSICLSSSSSSLFFSSPIPPRKLTHDFLQDCSNAARSVAHCGGTTSPCAVPRALGGVPDASTHSA